MSELGSIAELTDALNKIRVQTELLNKMAGDMKQWKVDWDVSIIPATLGIKITAMKPFGGGGVIKTISKEDIEYYKNDPDTLADLVAEEIFQALLKDVLRKDLRAKLPNVMEVVLKMDNKKL